MAVVAWLNQGKRCGESSRGAGGLFAMGSAVVMEWGCFARPLATFSSIYISGDTFQCAAWSCIDVTSIPFNSRIKSTYEHGRLDAFLAQQISPYASESTKMNTVIVC